MCVHCEHGRVKWYLMELKTGQWTRRRALEPCLLRTQHSDAEFHEGKQEHMLCLPFKALLSFLLARLPLHPF